MAGPHADRNTAIRRFHHTHDHPILLLRCMLLLKEGQRREHRIASSGPGNCGAGTLSQELDASHERAARIEPSLLE
ncbi:MAG: hypothetical protein HY710_07605 [Candidatus Latescibacteria bacterium]|nr:hypothetical protein [Candidatus Latescibacterota bacterium]